MASENEPAVRPEKVVIVAGPSFGTAVKFMLLGAAMGAAAVTLLHKRQHADERDAVLEGLSAGGAAERSENEMLRRLSNLARRAKDLATRAGEQLQHAGETLGPRLQEALHEARQAAEQTAANLQEDLDAPADVAGSAKPSVADGETPPRPVVP